MSVVHGGADDAELAAHGLRAEDVLDLSANLHPDGPHPAVIEAARSAPLDRYPHAEALPLREAIAAAYHLDPVTVLPVPGGTAAIHLVARVLLKPDERAFVITPAFGEYAAAARSAGATVVEVRTPPPDFSINVNESPFTAVARTCA